MMLFYTPNFKCLVYGKLKAFYIHQFEQALECNSPFVILHMHECNMISAYNHCFLFTRLDEIILAIETLYALQNDIQLIPNNILNI